jgi:geranylgeranyl diphosphate synthase type I
MTGTDMVSGSERIDDFARIIKLKGKPAMDTVLKELLNLPQKRSPVSSAIQYFAKVTLDGALPVFPALMALSCEAVGGEAEKTTSVGAALTLMAGASDIHDDIIDNSTTKYRRKTVFGKFGGDMALLSGDNLLIRGSMLLCEECEQLRESQRAAILRLLPRVLLEISNAEATETLLKDKVEVTPQEYSVVIESKAAVPELYCKIGAILGEGEGNAVKMLGYYGRTFGTVALIREEFIDLAEPDELRSRLSNELPPLPMLCALQNPATKKNIAGIIKDLKTTPETLRGVVEVVMASGEVQKLKESVDVMTREGKASLKQLQNSEAQRNLALLIGAIGKGL